MFRCICSSCRTEKFSRCGGCHLVPYCSKECQVEHRSQHRKLCKDLAKRETSTELLSVTGAFSMYWTHLSPRLISIPLPTQLPSLDIPWIGDYLTNLLHMILAVGRKVQGIVLGVWKGSMGHLLYLSSFMKDGKVTEFHFAAFFFFFSSSSLISIEKLDSKMRAQGTLDVVWETFIFQLARFFQILRMVKYKTINIKSIRKKKPAQYQAIKPFYESGLRMLESQTDCSLYHQTSRLSLPPGTLCVGCRRDIGGKEAQLLLMLKDDYKVVRVPGTPCLLDLSDSAKTIVVCGLDETCSAKAKDLYQQLLREEREALQGVLSDTRICYGCSRFSLKTHRCSRCRLARYCSQDCLNQNWKEHKIRCKEFTRPGFKDLYASKKLVDEDGFRTLCSYDPFLRPALTSVMKDQEVD